MTRVQIPAYTDRWMMGDRYGEIVKTAKQSKRPRGNRMPKRLFETVEVAYVKLDKSGKTMRFVLADCTEV